ncbi:MAG: bifunctional oligoribonuclease/PAP phosphatase NrnA [Planctomycetes bacterium]|nr:bifunctional oligoribonuclease/PAP phosphatase NrnA [Planctomycetota bacterium]MBI3846806.1 bifunctional oligoribonuclease/PAP phosphatase NrnA [Planctomycetota bacterium]
MEREVLEHLLRYRSLLLTTHEPLDGDGVGSELGLAKLLARLGKQVRIVNACPTPDTFRFLPGIETVQSFPAGMNGAVDAVVTLDCGTRDRVARVLDAVPGKPFVVNVDHHAGNEPFADVNWFDESCAATGQMIYRLAIASGVEIDADMALALYTALVSDTGRFSYSNTTPACHEMAAHLLRCGAKPSLVLRHLYREKPLSLVRLEGMAAQELRFAGDGEIAWTHVTQAMCRSAGITQIDARDIIDIPASVQGVIVAVLFREMETGRPTKVSFRSSGVIDVNRFAARFGGGGHARAAGCQFQKPIGDVEPAVIRDLEAALAEAKREHAGD